MAHITRQIGLSLGADICWPICFEAILKRLELAIPWQGDTLGFDASRVTIEPFDLRQPVRYDLVIDRVTQEDGTIKWAVRTDGKMCLSLAGVWCYEPFPSNRPADAKRAPSWNDASVGSITHSP